MNKMNNYFVYQRKTYGENKAGDGYKKKYVYVCVYELIGRLIIILNETKLISEGGQFLNMSD